MRYSLKRWWNMEKINVQMLLTKEEHDKLQKEADKLGLRR